MTIRLFQDINLRGNSQRMEYVGAVSRRRDVANFRGSTVGNNPSSLTMQAGDAILLCNKKNWNGEVLYLRGPRTVRDLGDQAQGGRSGFRNAVTSARVRPFVVELNVTIAMGEDGTLPGPWTSRDDAEADIFELIDMMNDFFDDQRALIRCRISDITFDANEEYYNVSVREYRPIPGRYKKAKKIDTLFSNRITGAVGVASFPWHGKHILMSASRDSDGPGFSRMEKLARTWVHELGHYWSLEHQSPLTQEQIDVLTRMNPSLRNLLQPSIDNIMIQSGDGGPFSSATLSSAQLNDIHQVLARNISRQGDRIEEIADRLI